jgi:UDP-N-acetyl-alpha-D-quinovosamine dehydrogenase
VLFLPMKRVLVTGARGFVGSTLCPMLERAGYRVRAAVRTDGPTPAGASEQAVVGEVGGQTDWAPALQGVDLVIHLAARVHVMKPATAVAASYFETNARGTERLAQEAARHDVRRFVYLSSVKVNGEETRIRAYTADDVPHPRDAYGMSKWQAEQLLLQAASGKSMRPAIIRPPLVYGPGVRANFLHLLRWIDMERPLPLGGVRNSRSLVSVWTLCDLVIRALDHPAAANRTWMVSDSEDISTPELVRRLASAMGRRTRLLPVPPALLRLAGGLLGKGAEVRRLCDSLTVDVARTRAELGWSPQLSMEAALSATVSWYLSNWRPTR